MHRYGRGRRILPIGVIPQVREQDIGHLAGRKAGHVFRHEVLTDRSMDEATPGFPGVDVMRTERHGHVIYSVSVSLPKLDPRRRDVVRPHPETRNGMITGPLPGPRPERGKAAIQIGLIVVIVSPSAGKYAAKHPGVELAPEFRQRSAAADDAVEGQDKRHRSGLLKARTLLDLRAQLTSSFRLSGKPAIDKGLNVSWIKERLQLADALRLVSVIYGELISP